MKIAILNIPSYGAFDYLNDFQEQLKSHNRFKDANFVVISEDIIKDHNSDLDLLQMSLNPTLPSDPNRLKDYAADADLFIIFSKTDDNDPDGYTFDLIHRINDLSDKPKRIIAECQHDFERDRLLKAGASSLIRPTRTYPSLLVRSIVSEGSEVALEEMISLHGSYKKVTVNKVVKWQEVLLSYYEKYGMAMGYIDREGNEYMNPKPDKICEISEILFFQ